MKCSNINLLDFIVGVRLRQRSANLGHLLSTDILKIKTLNKCKRQFDLSSKKCFFYEFDLLLVLFISKYLLWAQLHYL